MKSLIRRIAFPVVAMGAILAGKADYGIDSKVEQSLQSTIRVPMEYSRTHMKAVLPDDIIYERYELTGYDGEEYCVQIVSSGHILVDGGDTAACDESIDTVVSGNGGIYTCDMDEMKCPVATEAYNLFKELNNTDAIKRAWYEMRGDCERTCYKTLGIPVLKEENETP